MAQVPEWCMQMLKQIITEIENRQNITRDQLALLLETTDTGDTQAIFSVCCPKIWQAQSSTA